jgi:hypothetical protein
MPQGLCYPSQARGLSGQEGLGGYPEEATVAQLSPTCTTKCSTSGINDKPQHKRWRQNRADRPTEPSGATPTLPICTQCAIVQRGAVYAHRPENTVKNALGLRSGRTEWTSQHMDQPKRRIASILSYPERLIRIVSASLGGLIYQMSLVLLPTWVRRSRLYQATVERLLRIAVELLGGVQGAFPAEAMSVGELAVRKAAGNVVELVSFAAVGWSPVWLLAAAANVMGGTKVYLQALIQDLQREHILPPQTQADSIEELLSALEQTLGQAADTIDLPPLNIDGMRTSWVELRKGNPSITPHR